jgi:hypothetical protein
MLHINPLQKHASLLLLGEKYMSLKPKRNAQKLIARTGIIAASWREIHLSLKPEEKCTQTHCENRYQCCFLDRDTCVLETK